MRIFALLFAFVASLLAWPAAAQIIDVPGRAPPPATTDARNLWLLDLSTGGRVTVWLRPDVAPNMVARIKTLTREKFYDGLTFHRVIEGFMAQGGDPTGDGTGGSKLPNVDKEFNYLPHVRGAVAAARANDENSANSQFYIMLAPRLGLDKKYTVFGRVIDGMQYVDTIERGEPPANPTRVIHAYMASDNPPPYQAATVTPLPETVAPLPATAPRRVAPARRPAPAK